MPSAVVLTIDGLGAKHLGPYGNTWIETPAFNRLATESLTMDGLYAPSPNRQAVYEHWWRQHNSHFVEAMNERGIHTQLLTDEPELFDYAATSPFAQQDKLAAPGDLRLAHEWDETHTASFFAQAIQAIESAGSDSLTWLHLRGLHNPWDAPYEYRQRFVDEEDPDPSGSSQVPSLKLDANYDPDTLHEIQCAFAGQVILLDHCLAVMHSVVRELAEQRDLLFMVSATGGFPLGEHLHVGNKGGNLLYHESLSVPAFVRYPNGEVAMKRRGNLQQFEDLTACLEDWLVHQRVTDQGSPRQFSVCQAGKQYLLRTPAWHIRYDRLSDDREADVAVAELYLKPDDQNEVNDVSDRCEAVVEAGRNLLLEWVQSPQAAISVDVPDILLEPLD